MADPERLSWHNALAFWLRYEGSKVHRIRSDPGKLTKYGIAQRFHPEVFVETLTWPQAQAILLDDYWLPNGCDQLARAGLRLTAWSLFDFCANSHAPAGRRALQSILKTRVDGRIGKNTIAAAKKALDGSETAAWADLKIAVELVKRRKKRAITRLKNATRAAQDQGTLPAWAVVHRRQKFLDGLINRHIDLAVALTSRRP